MKTSPMMSSLVAPLPVLSGRLAAQGTTRPDLVYSDPDTPFLDPLK